MAEDWKEKFDSCMKTVRRNIPVEPYEQLAWLKKHRKRTMADGRKGHIAVTMFMLGILWREDFYVPNRFILYAHQLCKDARDKDQKTMLALFKYTQERVESWIRFTDPELRGDSKLLRDPED